MRASDGIGRAWRELASEAEHRLRLTGFDGEVIATISADGLLQLSLSRRDRSARAVLARYEADATALCERCGQRGSVRAGFVLRIRCDDCEYQRGSVPQSGQV